MTVTEFEERQSVANLFLQHKELPDKVNFLTYYLMDFELVIERCQAKEQLHSIICSMIEWFVRAIEQSTAQEPSKELSNSISNLDGLGAVLDSSLLFTNQYCFLGETSKESMKNGLVDLLIAKNFLMKCLGLKQAPKPTVAPAPPPKPPPSQPSTSTSSTPYKVPPSPPLPKPPNKPDEQFKYMNDCGENVVVTNMRFLQEDLKNVTGTNIVTLAKLQSECTDLAFTCSVTATFISRVYEQWLESLPWNTNLGHYSRKQFCDAIRITNLRQAKNHIDNERRLRLSALQSRTKTHPLIEADPTCPQLNSIHEYLEFRNKKVVDQFDCQSPVNDSHEAESLLLKVPQQYRVRVLQMELELPAGDVREIHRVLSGNQVGSNFTLGDLQIALRHHTNFRLTVDAYLQCECVICGDVTPFHQTRGIFRPTFCQCVMCLECYISHLSNIISRDGVWKWKCPGGKHPRPGAEDDSQLLRLIDDWRRSLEPSRQGPLPATSMPQKIVDTFKTKVEQYQLKKVPGAAECPLCQFVAVYNTSPDPKVRCKGCERFFCKSCYIPWGKKHDEFGQNPQGCRLMQNHLNRESLPDELQRVMISCANPKCLTMVEKVLGHCEDFKCYNCKWQFCPCGVVFYTTENPCPYKCDMGLHGHHPRNCFTHLRDRDLPDLKALLQMRKIPFGRTSKDKKCPTLVDLPPKPCDKPVVEMGYCLIHLKLYLSDLIIENKIDPIENMRIDEVKEMFRVGFIVIPEQQRNETDEQYLARLKQILVQKWPMGQLMPSK